MEVSKYISRLFKVIIGSIITGVGISIMVNGIFGVDTLSVFMSGIAKLINIPFSLSTALVNFTIIFTVFVFNKKVVGIGSIVNAVVIAITIQVTTPTFYALIQNNSVLEYLVIIIGPILIGIGAAIYVHEGLGAAALESLTLFLCGKFKKLEIAPTRMTLDFLFAVVGMLLGGALGIGTVTTIIIVGPTFAKTSEILKKLEAKQTN